MNDLSEIEAQLRAILNEDPSNMSKGQLAFKPIVAQALLLSSLSRRVFCCDRHDAKLLELRAPLASEELNNRNVDLQNDKDELKGGMVELLADSK
jgi:hypothetical protein